ncbi:hypothetical protein HK405_009820, partial [Cladochytrium tenue]
RTVIKHTVPSQLQREPTVRITAIDWTMGNILSSSVSGNLASERNTWIVTTASHRNAAQVIKSVDSSSCFAHFTRISLCCQPRVHGSFSYCHYFILLEAVNDPNSNSKADGGSTPVSSCTTNAVEVVEFDGESFESAIVILHNRPKFGPVLIERTLEVKSAEERLPFQQRILEVLGFRDYSLFLRNCEHVANYIIFKSWHSKQTVDSGSLRSVFLKILTDEARRASNVEPSILRWLPEQVALLPTTLQEILQQEIAGRIEANRKEGVAVRALHEIIGKKRFKFEYRSTDTDGRNITAATKVVLFLGPTGAGKSRIINMLLGYAAAESKISVVGVTRSVHFYYAVLNGETIKNLDYCFIDTAGVCDSYLSDKDIHELVKDRLRITLPAIDHIIFVINQRIEKPQIDAMNRYVKWLDLDRHPDSVHFFMTRCEGMKAATKDKLAESLKQEPIYNNLKFEREIEVFGSGEKVRASNIITVGFPDPEEYEIAETWKPAISESFDRVLGAVTYQPSGRAKDCLGKVHPDF